MARNRDRFSAGVPYSYQPCVDRLGRQAYRLRGPGPALRYPVMHRQLPGGRRRTKGRQPAPRHWTSRARHPRAGAARRARNPRKGRRWRGSRRRPTHARTRAMPTLREAFEEFVGERGGIEHADEKPRHCSADGDGFPVAPADLIDLLPGPRAMGHPTGRQPRSIAARTIRAHASASEPASWWESGIRKCRQTSGSFVG